MWRATYWKNDMKNSKNKKDKRKIVYVDDGSQIADMSGLYGSGIRDNGTRKRSTFKEKFETYISVVKMMFLPMLTVMGIITLAYLVLYIILSFA